MSEQNPIYFNSVRRMMIGFATIFREMYITRMDKDGATVQDVRIPLEYGSKQHWFRKMKEREMRSNSESSSSKNLTLPRMSFYMNSFEYDSSRKLNTMNYASNELAKDMQGKQLAPVPYNIGVSLNVWATNIEDLLMIIEQILPMFSPQINLRLREVDNMDIWNDIDIIMQGGPQIVDNYEQTLESNRLITCDFAFTIKGNIYPPVKNQSLIHKVITRFDNAFIEPMIPLSEITVEANQTDPPDFDKDNSSTSVEISKWKNSFLLLSNLINGSGSNSSTGGSSGTSPDVDPPVDTGPGSTPVLGSYFGVSGIDVVDVTYINGGLADGAFETVLFQNGAVLSFTYTEGSIDDDLNGLIETVGDGSSKLVTISYDSEGRIAGITYA